MRNIINFLIFQAAWFITVTGASAGLPWVGPVFTLLWLILHLTIFAARPIAELNLLLLCAVLGYVADSLLVVVGMIEFPARTQLGMPSTLWMVALWVNLGMTLNFSLSWLARYPVISILFGFLGGPLAYYLGGKLAAILLVKDVVSLLTIGLMWGAAMPLLFLFSQLTQKQGRNDDIVPGSIG